MNPTNSPTENRELHVANDELPSTARGGSVTTLVLAALYGVALVVAVVGPIAAVLVATEALSPGLLGVLFLWLLAVGLVGTAPRFARRVVAVVADRFAPVREESIPADLAAAAAREFPPESETH